MLLLLSAGTFGGNLLALPLVSTARLTGLLLLLCLGARITYCS